MTAVTVSNHPEKITRGQPVYVVRIDGEIGGWATEQDTAHRIASDIGQELEGADT